MAITLKNHPVWHTLNQTLQQLDPQQIALQHLQACNTQIDGYWDNNDEFYETIRFTVAPHPELTSIAWGIASGNAQPQHWLQLTCALKVEIDANTSIKVGDLILSLDENLDTIDENWLVDLQSPYIQVSS